ncbi:hypothetical protein [Primorskyibacter sp. S87]|uniref:hypothetical protein n=1 Tax=Primorskyibacter sp. S87 TaxID=3415126 RepID=UPI003C7BBACB
MKNNLSALPLLVAGAAILAACDDSSSTASAPSAAESNCLAAVANQTGVGEVSTISVSPSEAGTSVMVQVAGAQAPWACVATNEGAVQEVYYTAEG